MIYINDIPSFRDPESISYSFDDRIEKVPLIRGNTVQDYGHIPSGGVFSITAVFSLSNYNLIRTLWENRTLVTFNDGNGGVWSNVRLVFRTITRDRNFPGYVTLTFELWRC